MALLINSYSFAALGLLLLLIMALLTWRVFGPQWVAPSVGVAFAFLVAFQLVASTKTSAISSTEDFNNALASGNPVLLELYSNF